MALICLKDYEDYAKQRWDRKTRIFFCHGAERDETLKENERAFTRIRLIPRMLRNVPFRSLTATILGERFWLPIGAAPIAYQKMAHPEGELAAAAAAAEIGAIYTLSSFSTSSIEDVSKVVSGTGPLWMQIYVMKDRNCTEKMIKQAEEKGFKALVMTVDTPVRGLRPEVFKDSRILPTHLRPINVMEALKMDPNKGFCEIEVASNVCETLTWDDVTWIRNISKLPVVIKGILSVEDAVRAAALGAAAVWVSNHGGRQLDGVDTAIDALPAIATALKGTGCEVYVDGGVRWGSDIFKALALGARAVFIGRPILWGLTHSGKDGVKKVFEILRDELDRTMHLAGCKDIEDIGPHLVRNSPYCRL